MNNMQFQKKDAKSTTICSSCTQPKLLSEFISPKPSSVGAPHWCKKCRTRAYDKARYQTIRQKKINYNKAWNHANKEKVRHYARRYHHTPRGKSNSLLGRLRKRARLAFCSFNDLTLDQLAFLFQKSHYCALCHIPFSTERKKTVDHIVPLSKGGNNTLLNIQIVCEGCNRFKGNRSYILFNHGQMLMFLKKGAHLVRQSAP